jgi:hypothetical protein
LLDRRLSHVEWLGLLLDREATDRYERRLRARLRFARLRHQAVVEDVDYRAARGLDRTLFQASIGTAGRLRSEQVADINRNARPTSSECAVIPHPPRHQLRIQEFSRV